MHKTHWFLSLFLVNLLPIFAISLDEWFFIKTISRNNGQETYTFYRFSDRQDFERDHDLVLNLREIITLFTRESLRYIAGSGETYEDIDDFLSPVLSDVLNPVMATFEKIFEELGFYQEFELHPLPGKGFQIILGNSEKVIDVDIVSLVPQGFAYNRTFKYRLQMSDFDFNQWFTRRN